MQWLHYICIYILKTLHTVKYRHLHILPAFLLCLMNHIIRLYISNKQRRIRIVFLHILSHQFIAVISIAISALVSACVISTYITCKITGTLFPCAFLLRCIQPTMKCCLICIKRHAAAAVCTIDFQFISLCTRFYCHFISIRNAN